LGIWLKEGLHIRDSSSTDRAAIESLYPKAFPDEDLLPLVRDLLQDPAVTTSIVGVIDSRVIAHIVFTACGVSGRPTSAVLLGPLAVTPEWHRQGIGSELVRAGLRQMEQIDTEIVCVLGDPAFYGRLGFLPDMSIEPPFPLPEEYEGAWQLQRLGAGTAPYSGALLVPGQWLQKSLWTS